MGGQKEKRQPDQGLIDRLRKAADRTGGPDAIARKVDVSRRTWGNYLQGATEPTSSTIKEVAKAAGLDPSWILTGLGPMEPQQGGRPSAVMDDVLLFSVIYEVEHFLLGENITIASAKDKVQLMRAVYELVQREQAHQPETSSAASIIQLPHVQALMRLAG
ncbi:helix-turn-helix domain-containing protein [Magnetococcus sp. PR-3]|uniref:helix-turn-helix domain-containing protein n=1 Tax=Magnetococcus sp. PR-3 TaxID=3120355 RepID=UPI002FCE40A2